MTREQLILAKLLTELYGEEFFGDFEHKFAGRLIAQKSVYLLNKVFKVPLNYGFSWYLSGPYSPALTTQLYAISKQNPPLGQLGLSKRALSIVERFRRLVSRCADTKMERADWLELLASVHFISHFRSLDFTTDTANLTRAVQYNKPKFRSKQIASAISLLAEISQ